MDGILVTPPAFKSQSCVGSTMFKQGSAPAVLMSAINSRKVFVLIPTVNGWRGRFAYSVRISICSILRGSCVPSMILIVWSWAIMLVSCVRLGFTLPSHSPVVPCPPIVSRLLQPASAYSACPPIPLTTMPCASFSPNHNPNKATHEQMRTLKEEKKIQNIQKVQKIQKVHKIVTSQQILTANTLLWMESALNAHKTTTSVKRIIVVCQ